MRQHIEGCPDDRVAFCLGHVAKRKGGNHHRGRAGGAFVQDGADSSRLAFDDFGSGESVLEPAAQLPVALDEDEFPLLEPDLEKGSGDRAGPGAELDNRTPTASSLHARACHDPCKGLRARQDRTDPARVGGPAFHEQAKPVAAQSRVDAMRPGCTRRVLSHDPVSRGAPDRPIARLSGNRPRRTPRTAAASHAPRMRCTRTAR